MARILVVDDSTMMRKKLGKVLTDGGHTVVGESSNGKQAVEDYEIYLPDVVTMDIVMPKMDGISATKKILEFDKNALIIMVTSMSHADDVYEAITSGAKNYIAKPFEDKKVLQVIDAVLRMKE